MKTTVRLLKNTHGSMMLYMLGMIVFISALTFSFTDTAKLYITDLQVVKKFRGRDFSNTQIQKMLSTTKSLSESALFTPQNDALRVCLDGGPLGTCTENCCAGNTQVGFTFKDPTDTAPQITNKRSLTGPLAAPIYYRQDGTLCDIANSGGDISSCAYTVTSIYEARCPASAANCDHAEHLKITVSAKALSFFSQIRDKEFISYYFPKLNYQPVVPVIPAQSLVLGTPSNVTITGDSGHPSEIQNFIFAQCLSAAPSIVKATCQDFAGGAAQIVLEPLAVGATTITLQINDGGLFNFLSKPYTFNVVVNP
jgi:hypothetical protein